MECCGCRWYTADHYRNFILEIMSTLEDTLNNIVNYFKNLLIIQYHDKPKAQATIEAITRLTLADGLLFQIKDAFRIKTAAGVQLDAIGDYAGIDRFFIFGDRTQLNDNEYRILIQLKRLQNSSNHSHRSIDEGLFNTFGNKIYATTDNDMTMNYFIDRTSEIIIYAGIYKNAFPRPMGIGLLFILLDNATYPNKKYFGFGSYDVNIDPLVTDYDIGGFDDYDNTNDTNSYWLTYDDIVIP